MMRTEYFVEVSFDRLTWSRADLLDGEVNSFDNHAECEVWLEKCGIRSRRFLALRTV